MTIHSITPNQKEAFNAVVSHPLQSYEWGEFREKTGLKVIRRGFFDGSKLISGFTLTIHPIPRMPWTIGYLPKGDLPDEELIAVLKQIGKEEKCIFIQLEPNVQRSQEEITMKNGEWKIVAAAHPLFTKYTFILDLTKSEDELLADMHPKARYNIKIAQKHGVEVVEDNSDEAFKRYWQLMRETTKRQKFYAHTRRYHQLLWNKLKTKTQTEIELTRYLETKTGLNAQKSPIADRLTAHLFLAKYQKQILTSWIVFVFHDTLYYPYGASSNEHRNVMHSNIMMWEVIRFGKKLGLKKFDMWGALGTNPDPKDPWFGFHDFKRKYGPKHVEFIGSYDLVINPLLYPGYKLADKLRWLYLKMKK